MRMNDLEIAAEIADIFSWDMDVTHQEVMSEAAILAYTLKMPGC